tara:strand:- start:47 stop:250 length:204 start_codon:yes stop_codon:yes gene_type:complete
MDEVIELLGVKSKSAAYSFIDKHDVKTGKITMKGRARKVVLKSSLMDAISAQGYDGSFNENDIVWEN